MHSNGPPSRRRLTNQSTVGPHLAIATTSTLHGRAYNCKHRWLVSAYKPLCYYTATNSERGVLCSKRANFAQPHSLSTVINDVCMLSPSTFRKVVDNYRLDMKSFVMPCSCGLMFPLRNSNAISSTKIPRGKWDLKNGSLEKNVQYNFQIRTFLKSNQTNIAQMGSGVWKLRKKIWKLGYKTLWGTSKEKNVIRF